jgi:hypothetical protein
MPVGSSSYTPFGQVDPLVTYAVNHHTSGDGIVVSGSNNTATAIYSLPSGFWDHLKVIAPSSTVGYSETNYNSAGNDCNP